MRNRCYTLSFRRHLQPLSHPILARRRVLPLAANVLQTTRMDGRSDIVPLLVFDDLAEMLHEAI